LHKNMPVFPLSLSQWKYRKAFQITEQAGQNLTDYQVLLKIGESSGATGANFHLEGLSAIFPSEKNQGGDLRFHDGQNELSFWVENVTGTSPNRIAYVWVKIPSLSANQTKTLYCYFGNSAATNASNGDNTFLLFDDFDDGVISSTKWADGAVKNYVLENNGIFATNTDSGITGSESANSGFFTINGTGTVDNVTEDGVTCGWLGKGLRSAPTFNLANGLRIKSGVNLVSFSLGNATYKGIQFGLVTAYDKDNRVDFDRTRTILGGTPYDFIEYWKEEAGTRTSGKTATGLTLTTGYRTLEYLKNQSNSFSFYENTTGGGITSTFNSSSARVGLFGAVRNVGDQIDVRFDWIFVSKYVSPEPAFSSAGALEKRSSIIPLII
jgi:hypothetical protein